MKQQTKPANTQSTDSPAVSELKYQLDALNARNAMLEHQLELAKQSAPMYIDFDCSGLQESIKEVFESSNHKVASAAYLFYKSIKDAQQAKEAYYEKLQEFDKQQAKRTKKKLKQVSPVRLDIASEKYQGKELQEIKDVLEYTDEAYQLYLKTKRSISKMKSKLLQVVDKEFDTKPDCFGLDDCSTACMSTCKFSKECGV